jgi:PKD domain
VVSMIVFNCMGYHGWTESNKPKKKNPKLVLSAQPRQGLAPHHVSISAKLEGVAENDPEWYCLKQEWDFGDGAVSAEEPNCDPYTPETKITTEFFADHTFEDPGHYPIRFKLGDEKLWSNTAVVVVIEGRVNPESAQNLSR